MKKPATKTQRRALFTAASVAALAPGVAMPKTALLRRGQVSALLGVPSRQVSVLCADGLLKKI
jgi:hypothetical protein